MDETSAPTPPAEPPAHGRPTGGDAPRPQPGSTSDPVRDLRSDDDRDVGWGDDLDAGGDRDARWYREQRPPHWE